LMADPSLEKPGLESWCRYAARTPKATFAQSDF
jgi:hypothetical protein